MFQPIVDKTGVEVKCFRRSRLVNLGENLTPTHHHQPRCDLPPLYPVSVRSASACCCTERSSCILRAGSVSGSPGLATRLSQPTSPFLCFISDVSPVPVSPVILASRLALLCRGKTVQCSTVVQARPVQDRSIWRISQLAK